MLESGAIGSDICIKERHRLFSGALRGNVGTPSQQTKLFVLPGEELESKCFWITGSGPELSARQHLIF